MLEENTFLKYLSDDLKPFADNTDCCTFIVRLRKENNEKDKEIERLNSIIDKLEKWLEKQYYIDVNNQTTTLPYNYYVKIEKVLNKLKELKEGK